MLLERPDLSNVSPDVLAYIEALEEALRQATGEDDSGPPEPSEPPTTINVITINAGGLAKRTPRHFYTRQRRGGMGVFGLETNDPDPPAFLLLADVSASLTLVTDQARAFRLAVADVAETPVSGRARPLAERFPLRAGERPALFFADPLPGKRGAYLALVTRRGQVRRIGQQYLGKNLQSGTVLYNVAEGGAPAAACWTEGSDELFIATRTGLGIRFNERLVPVRGCLGMRVDPSDEVIGIAAAPPDGGVFLLSHEGKGTIRLLSGFGANKEPGGGGKTAIKAERVVAAVGANPQDDLFILSRLGKVIRFAAAEIPAKEGVVQGVNCMSLRADECVAAVASPGAS
ncbi:MAG TPA: DNA gyrase C-terminal beta-propeller domain-containing protein [Caldilineaceae bacterium]|nr:DNA gyrase C-terminal beta-propeller domain-containing protein [Caldilineaceae bacterium]